MSNWQKVVGGACKPKHAPPKSKYIDALVSCTYQSDGSLQDVSRALRSKLRDPNSSVVFKALLVIHTLVRAGNSENVMGYWSGVDGRDGRSIGLKDVCAMTDTPQNLTRYSNYLLARFKCYAALKHDPIRTRAEAPATLRNSSKHGANRLRTLTVEKGLLREVSMLQKLLDALVDCKFYLEDTDDDLVMSALRLLVKDLLVLFQAVNEGVINVLEHYFEMSHVDATTALKTYKIFCKQCEKVVAYLGVAKKLQNIIHVNIPNLRHAPVSLVNSLEEYLNDPNFEANRQEYRANKRTADRSNLPSPTPTARAGRSTEPAAPAPPSPKPAEGQKAFIDFFESIETEQQSMFNPNSQSPNSNYFQQQAVLTPFGSQPTGLSNPVLAQTTGFPNLPPPDFSAGRASMGQALFGTLNNTQPLSLIQAQPTGFAAGGQLPIQNQMTGANPFRASVFTSTPSQMLAPQQTGYNPFTANSLQRMSVGPAFEQQHNMPICPWQNLPDRSAGAMSAPPVETLAPPVVNLNSSSTPTALKAQITGSRNPFAPIAGTPPAVPKLPDAPSLNALAASAFSQSMVQQRLREQAAQLQFQQQQQQDVMQAPKQVEQKQKEEDRLKEIEERKKAEFNNFFSSQLEKLEGGGKDSKKVEQGVGSVSGLFTDVASEFAVSKPKLENQDAGSSTGNLSFQPTGVGIGAQPMGIGMNFLSSQPTGFLHSQPTGFLSSQPTGINGSLEFNSTLQPQRTGFGGSAVKPFQPSSSFGTQLINQVDNNVGKNPFKSQQQTDSNLNNSLGGNPQNSNNDLMGFQSNNQSLVSTSLI